MPSGAESDRADRLTATPAPPASIGAPELAATSATVCQPAAEPVRRKSGLREAIEAFVIALVVAVFIRSFVVQAFKIPSGSMQPTLQIGDHILVNKFIYGIDLPVTHRHLGGLTTPHRGDVVVFEYPVDPSKDFIKRVVGLPGDVVQIRNKHVYINGQPWEDSHAYFADGTQKMRTGPRDNFGPVTVPTGHVFVMGDNRDRSYDSRFWGFVDLAAVKGRAFLIYWSWDGQRRAIRWERLAHAIH